MEYIDFPVRLLMNDSSDDTTEPPTLLLLNKKDGSSSLNQIQTTTESGIFNLMLSSPLQNAWHYVQLISLIFITSCGFVANVLVFLLFYRRPSLRSFSNRFILNLSFAHLLQCILTQPTTSLSFMAHSWILGSTCCLVTGIVSTILNTASVLSLLLIALDRNCAVNSPLHYTTTVTKKRTGVLIVGLWALSILVAVPPLFGVTTVDFRRKWHSCTMKWSPWNPYSITYGTVLFLLGFIVPLFMTSIVYCSMFRAARNNSERARKHSLNSTLGEIPIPEGPIKPVINSTSKKKFRRWSSGSSQSSFFGDEWKAVRTGLLVVITFVFCWFPYFCITYVETFFPIEVHIPNYIMFFAILFSFSACVINPYLYVFRNKSSRKQIRKLFKCFTSSATSSSSRQKKWTNKQNNVRSPKATATNPCILAASLVNNTSEKVKAFPMLYQDNDGQWQMFSTSEERSHDDLDEITSNISDDFLEREHFDFGRRKSSGNINVHAIYGNNFTRASLPRNISFNSLSVQSNKLLLYRIREQMNRDSTSSDTTENYSMSLDSNNGSDMIEKDFSILPTRCIMNKFFFGSAMEEMKETRYVVAPLKKVHHSSSEDMSEEQNLNNNISFIGSIRRRSFIHSHIKNRRKSSETTLTSSTNSETLDSAASTPTLQNKESRPRLIRQEETSALPKLKNTEKI